MEEFQKIKARVAARDSEVLLNIFHVYQAEPEDMETEDLVVFTAITSELENRGLIRFEDTMGQYLEVK